MLIRKIKNNLEWDTSFIWLWKCQNDQFSAYCETWEKSFAIIGGGVDLIEQHEKAGNHISKTEKTLQSVYSTTFRCILVPFEWYRHPKKCAKKVLVTPFPYIFHIKTKWNIVYQKYF